MPVSLATQHKGKTAHGEERERGRERGVAARDGAEDLVALEVALEEGPRRLPVQELVHLRKRLDELGNGVVQLARDGVARVRDLRTYAVQAVRAALDQAQARHPIHLPT
jgi:hypothetical protein